MCLRRGECSLDATARRVACPPGLVPPPAPSGRRGRIHPSLPEGRSPAPRVGYDYTALLGKDDDRTYTGWSAAVTGCALCRKITFSRQNPKIVYWKINDFRVQTFLFSGICDRTLMLPGSTTTHENRIYKAGSLQKIRTHWRVLSHASKEGHEAVWLRMPPTDETFEGDEEWIGMRGDGSLVWAYASGFVPRGSNPETASRKEVQGGQCDRKDMPKSWKAALITFAQTSCEHDV